MKTKPKKATRTPKAKKPKVKQVFPPGWDEKRVKELIDYYDNQTEDVAEDEAAYRTEGQTMMMVPTTLVPEIRKLIARREA